MSRPIRALIDRAAMSHNLGRVMEVLHRPRTGGGSDARPLVWAVIKADAYGHGIENAVAAFSQADGLAMLDFAEAVRCRHAGWDKPILMLEGVFGPQDLEACVQWRLWPVVHEVGQIVMLERAKLRQPLKVFLKLDSGMHRLGFDPGTYGSMYRRLVDLKAAGKVSDIAHMTHFACADESDGIDEPLAVFRNVVKGLPGEHCVANSAAVLRHTEAMLRVDADSDFGQASWVRPGICLYGASPLADMSADRLGLRASMTLVSRVLSVRVVRAGQGIGYSYLYRPSQDVRVAVVACGYADGYPRHAPCGTPVAVNGQLATLVGRVSMDMLTVDVSGLPSVNVGDQVILWGQGGPGIDEVAQASGTISYELMTAVTARVRRQLI